MEVAIPDRRIHSSGLGMLDTMAPAVLTINGQMGLERGRKGLSRKKGTHQL